MMKLAWGGVLLLLWLTPIHSWGGKVYRCQTDGGAAVFTDQPCMGKYGPQLGEPQEMGGKSDKHPINVIPSPLSESSSKPKPRPAAASPTGAASSMEDPNARASQPSIPGMTPAATPSPQNEKKTDTTDSTAKTERTSGGSRHDRIMRRSQNAKDKEQPAVRSIDEQSRTPWNLNK